MSDQSSIGGRVYTERHIKTFLPASRWPYWYRLRKPDGVRNTDKSYMYGNVNSQTPAGMTDDEYQSAAAVANINARVIDVPAQFSLIGQIPALIHSERAQLVDRGDLKERVVYAKATIPWDYTAQDGDHLIQLEENISADNRKEWLVESIENPSHGQFRSASLRLLVGVYG